MRRSIQPGAFRASQSPTSLSIPRRGIPVGGHLAPGGVQPNLQTLWTLISWSLRVQQRQLTANTALTVGYVGSHGYHELIGIDANVSRFP